MILAKHRRKWLTLAYLLLKVKHNYLKLIVISYGQHIFNETKGGLDIGISSGPGLVKETEEAEDEEEVVVEE